MVGVVAGDDIRARFDKDEVGVRDGIEWPVDVAVSCSHRAGRCWSIDSDSIENICRKMRLYSGV